jgi:hypothetical protein
MHFQKLTLVAAAALAGLPLAGASSAADWITAPSYYTHDPLTAERVCQYSPIGPFYYYARADYAKSGYRHTRSSLNLGNSADNLHIVEEWGRPVRPYEEWRFPYRPYSVPYDLWGPPFGGLGQTGGLYPYGGGIGPYPYGGGFGQGGFGHGGHRRGSPPVNFAQPWLDGHYPEYDLNDRSPYWKPYEAP